MISNVKVANNLFKTSITFKVLFIIILEKTIDSNALIWNAFLLKMKDGRDELLIGIHFVSKTFYITKQIT